MSKLTALIAIPIALLGLKRLQETIKDEPTTAPLIPQGFTIGPAATGQDFNLLPTTLEPTQVAPSIDPLLPTGPIKQPSAEIPKFVPFDILGSGGDASGLKDIDFTFKPFGGLLSPEAQANIARYQASLK